LNTDATPSTLITCKLPFARFEYENDLVDDYGHVTPALLNGNQLYGVGRVGSKCLTFDGSTWYNQAGWTDAIYKSSFTINFWINNADDGFNWALISQGGAGITNATDSDADKAFLVATSTTVVLFSFYQDEVASKGSVTLTSTWSFVSLVYDQSLQLKYIYKNAVLSATSLPGNNYIGSSGDTVLGTKVWYSSLGAYRTQFKPFVGCLDELTVYQWALSQSQLSQLYTWYTAP